MTTRQHLFKLMGGIFQDVRKILDAKFADLDLSRNEWLIMAMLRLSPDGVSQAEALKYTGVEKSYLSKVLNKLEEKGYLVREIDPNNRRNRILKANPRARKKISAVYNIIQNVTEKTQADLNDNEIKELYALLAKIHGTLNQNTF